MFVVIKDLLKHDRRFCFSFVVFLFVGFMVVLSFFSPYDPRSWQAVPADLPHSLSHPFGTTSLGQDLFWWMTHAIRNSLIIVIIVVIVSRILATFVGLISGYKGGSTERILMLINDSFVIMPILPMVIFFSLILKPIMNIYVLSLILAMFAWAWDGRLIRSMVLSLREREYSQTAVFSGMGTLKVVLREHLPFVLPLIMATGIADILYAIGFEITLSIFGLSDLGTPTLGTTIYWAINYQAIFLGHWWWISTPVIWCILIVVGSYMLSRSINEFLDPRTRLQRIKLKSQ